MRLGLLEELGHLLHQAAQEGRLEGRLHLAGTMLKTPEEWAEALALELAEGLAQEWDRYGAPTAARTEFGAFIASFEGPGGATSVYAESKRQAYRQARAEWLKRLLMRL
ncbi:hypothetical protein [Thermus sp.]|uniref:hypothetical protein n=1 Tax=Thermus sp. TaxID=275 RepID=UPI0025E1567A|nr:hypothetical protein [Thermus sp.]MCS6868624.1 hypothetical protein [Thermus sp.]